MPSVLTRLDDSRCQPPQRGVTTDWHETMTRRNVLELGPVGPPQTPPSSASSRGDRHAHPLLSDLQIDMDLVPGLGEILANGLR